MGLIHGDNELINKLINEENYILLGLLKRFLTPILFAKLIHIIIWALIDVLNYFRIWRH